LEVVIGRDQLTTSAEWWTVWQRWSCRDSLCGL